MLKRHILSTNPTCRSWRAALDALSSPENARYEWTFERFLTDEDSLKLLEKPLDPFSHPSPQTKSQFEALTAPINITPSHHGQFNIDQIKGDALWLSEQTKINEPAALRIVVLEWQSRQDAQLLGKWAVSGSNGHEVLDFGSSRLLSRALAGYDATDAATFSSTTHRRSRSLQLYFSEKASILRISEILLRAHQYEDDIFARRAEQAPRAKGNGEAKREQWYFAMGQVIREDMEKPEGSFLTKCISALEKRLEDLEKGSGCYEEGIEPKVEDTFGAENVAEIIHITQMMSTHLEDISVPDSHSIRAWYGLMTKYQFFNELQFANASLQALVQPLQALTSLVSLQMLKIATILQILDNAAEACITSYLADREAVKEINQALILAAEKSMPTVASPAVFAWAIIIDAWRGFSEYITTIDDAQFPPGLDENNTREILDSFEEVRNPPLDVDLIQFFAQSAISVLQVHEVIPALAITLSKIFNARIDYSFRIQARNALFSLIVNSLGLVQYSEPVIISALALLQGKDGFWDIVQPPVRTATRAMAPAEALLNNDWAKDRLLVQAQSRYPLEIVPLMQFCQALCAGGILDQDGLPVALRFMRDMPRYTQRLPHGVEPYSLVREDENQNFACLDQELPMFGHRGSQQEYHVTETRDSRALMAADGISGEETLRVPAGTLGNILEDTSKPFIGCWEFSYPGIAHQALLLSTFVSGSHRVEYATRAPIDRFQATEIIGLLASVLAVCARHDNVGGAHAVLEAASDGLDRTEDIITTVLTILDEGLQTSLWEADLEGTFELLFNCMHFAYAITKLLPHRIWPFLSRSSLLDLDGPGGNLINIVSAEMNLGRHEFLASSVRLFDALIEDAITGTVERKAPGKQITRFEEAKAGGSGTTGKAMEKIITAFTRVVSDVFQSAASWRFDDANEKLELDTIILQAFEKMLIYVYGYDDTHEPSMKMTAMLAPGARYLLATFLAPSGNDLALDPLLKTLAAGTAITTTTFLSDTTTSWISRTVSTLGFVNTLLKTRTLLDLETPQIEMRLFEACPILARLYVAQESFKVPTLSLLETMILSAGQTNQEPPSLLGHLGSETSKCFLKVLSNLSKPLEDSLLELKIWQLLSAVVSSRQQWFAIFLLTGDSGRGSTRKEKNDAGKSHGRPLLQYALDQLANPENFQDKQRANAMLDFIALAQDKWPWAVLEVRKHPKFIGAIADVLNNQDHPDSDSTNEKSIRMCNDNRAAARIADVLAMCLHEARQTGDVSLAKDLSSKLYYYRDNAIQGADTAYNESLHRNLVRNFEMKYLVSPNSFKRTVLTATPSSFGDNYFYALEYANKVLAYDPSWSSRKGFRYEFQSLNIMLSLVESHVMLLDSWKNLALELSRVLKEAPALQLHMAKVVQDCVRDKTKSRLPAHIKDGLLQTRIDLAFTLTQKLVEASSTEPDVQTLFSTVWATLRDSDIDLETGLTGPDASYYRTMLKILFLSLQPHLVTANSQPSANPSTSDKRLPSNLTPEFALDILDVLSDVVCTSFRHLCTTLHASDPPISTPGGIKVPPSDFVMLMALLQSILALPDISTLYPKIYLRITNSNLIRYTTSLFSWSDQLIVPPEYDPIFGELSLLFLLGLSSVPALAHQIAVDGVLAALSTAELINFFRRPRGAGAFDPPTRLYSIWYRGLLPLCLNLLRHVGAPIAVEVAGFLNQFPAQLGRAAHAIAAPASAGLATKSEALVPLTLGLASEFHSLALIELILARFRNLGPAAGVQSEEIPRLDASFAWRGVREDIETWLAGNRKALRERIMPVGEREAALLRQEAMGRERMCENRLEERVVGELEKAARRLKEVGEL